MLITIHPETPQGRLISRATETLRQGGIVIYPTDTVYGIGCSIFNAPAIERIHAIKGQHHSKPFSFICSDLSNISEYARVSNPAYRLIKSLIPGPYTFVLPASRLKQLPKSLITRRKAVGIRVPDNIIAQSLIRELGHPVLGASVTGPDGGILNDPAVIEELYGHRVDLILDAGPGRLEVSTILDLTDDRPVVVREGAGDISMLLMNQ